MCQSVRVIGVALGGSFPSPGVDIQPQLSRAEVGPLYGLLVIGQRPRLHRRRFLRIDLARGDWLAARVSGRGLNFFVRGDS